MNKLMMSFCVLLCAWDILLLIAMVVVWNYLPITLSLIATYFAYVSWNKTGGFGPWRDLITGKYREAR